MKRLAFVVHRYGKEVNGGIEDHCHLLAIHLKSHFEVDVLTTCSFMQWDNKFPAGKTIEDGVNIIRFTVIDPPDDSITYYNMGPYSPDLIEYLREHGKDYESVILMTFSFGLTGLKYCEGLNNSILLPAIHDLPGIRHKDYYDEFNNAYSLLYNSVEEKQLVKSVFNIGDIPSRTTCFGLDLSDYSVVAANKEEAKYILYAGRVSCSKKFDVLNEYFLRYKRENPSDLKLIVVGSFDNYMRVQHHEDIIFKGFVSEEEKIAYFNGAECVICPSLYESLCIVLLEAFACKRPVLVNGECAVLKGQCERSNGGLYYSSYDEFEAELDYILGHPDIADEMGRNGYRYVKEEYNWDLVINNVISLIDEMNGRSFMKTNHRIEDYQPDRSRFDVREIVKGIKDKIGAIPNEISKYEQYSQELIKRLSENKEIIIVGSGKKGIEAKSFLHDNGIKNVVCIADNGNNEYISVKEACSEYPHAVFLITPRYHMKELMKEIVENSISLEQVELYLR